MRLQTPWAVAPTWRHDLEGSVGPVTIDIPPALLKTFPTTPDEVERRKAVEEAAAAA